MGEVEFMDAEILKIHVNDLSDSMISFEVFMELQLNVKEGDYTTMSAMNALIESL